MAKLFEEARDYKPPTTKNIADLDKIPVDVEVEEREFHREDGTAFKIKVIVVDGEEYKVPVSVLKDLKAILAEKPELKEFKVTKTGEGLKTKYTVITL